MIGETDKSAAAIWSLNRIEDLIESVDKRGWQRSEFKRGDFIIRQGATANTAFLQLNGNIKVVMNYESESPTILTYTSGGVLIGLPSVMTSRLYQVSAIATENTEGVFIAKKELLELLDQNTGTQEVLGNMARDILHLQQRIAAAAKRTSKEKFAHLLSIMVNTYGMDEHGRLLIKATIKELAEILCVSRDTMHRILKEFREEGAIEVENKKIYVLDTDFLKNRNYEKN